MSESSNSAWPFGEISGEEGLDIEAIFKDSTGADQSNPFASPVEAAASDPAPEAQEPPAEPAEPVPAPNLAAASAPTPKEPETPAAPAPKPTAAPPAEKPALAQPEVSAAAENPIAAAFEQKTAENTKKGLLEKPPVFYHKGVKEEIEEPSMTFEELRIRKSEDFTDLEEGKRVSWSVEYCGIRKEIKDPKGTTIISVKETIERSHEFLAALKKSKEKDPCCYVKPKVEMKTMAGQLHQGVSGFNLMSTGYKPIYEVLNKFTSAFPTGQKTNAAVIGRLMNNIKLGYYPTDPDNISLILRGIRFPDGVTTNLFDPCCGCGKALRQLAQGNNCYAYGVELDESRAEEAQTRLHRVGFGSFFHSRISHEAFHLLFLNPPYLSVINESGGRSRHEKRFLIESLPPLMYGGLLIYVIPYYRLTPDICRVLVDNFDDLSVWRFTDSEFKQFKQVAIFGVRKHRDAELQDTLWLERLACSPASIPTLEKIEEGRYALPAQPLQVNTFKGERFNQKELEQQLRKSDSFAQMMRCSELDSGAKRPLLPLSISQIGLIGGSGMINGLIECDSPHIIKGRIVKVVRTESEEKFSASGNHLGSEVKETITNKMIFNVLTPNGFKALT